MRSYAVMQYPGIDFLGQHGRVYWIAKQLQSVSRQLGKTTLLSELDGCTGWQMSLEDYKSIGDWQALYGINLALPASVVVHDARSGEARLSGVDTRSVALVARILVPRGLLRAYREIRGLTARLTAGCSYCIRSRAFGRGFMSAGATDSARARPESHGSRSISRSCSICLHTIISISITATRV